MSLQTEEIYRTLLLYSADAVIVTDCAGTITTTNPSFAKLVGAAVEELIGTSLANLVVADWEHAEEKTLGQNINADISEAESAGDTQAVTILSRTGSELIMPAARFPLFNQKSGKPDGHLTIIYVIQANSLQQAQTEFVSTVSHELRTPLTSIKGFADTILRAGDRLDSSQQRRYVGIIKDQADRLTRLVEDLLAVSRLESKKLQLTIRALDLKEAIERVQQNLADKAKKHSVILQIPPGLTPVWADADRLEQILTNLIDNAIKYSQAGTTVTITAKGIQDTPEMVEFSVCDQGVGIPEEHLPQVFSKFGRLDNPLVRQTEGTGLGLYITRSLVLALGGQITVESVPGSTTFTVKLPAATPEQQAARGRG
ncbi:MAG: PAS domain S-box protein [Candidatus Obscuribacter phosphatis]|uniref:histidine kinase n=1 Tax=Candidatus Obscuribacter phosphatis TaxID=1906157 RepID=A0A8J7P931_9BACT|nr:PAS domain S-box protein [Candidatus Obscuribacter phosphatis]